MWSPKGFRQLSCRRPWNSYRKMHKESTDRLGLEKQQWERVEEWYKMEIPSGGRWTTRMVTFRRVVFGSTNIKILRWGPYFVQHVFRYTQISPYHSKFSWVFKIRRKTEQVSVLSSNFMSGGQLLVSQRFNATMLSVQHRRYFEIWWMLTFDTRSPIPRYSTNVCPDFA